MTTCYHLITLSESPGINQTLLKQFRVDAFVATEGMGTVYRAWDLKRSTPLAMKVLHRDLAEDLYILKYIQGEAKDALLGGSWRNITGEVKPVF